MLKDVIQEYDEYFPEIIERASYALEKTVIWEVLRKLGLRPGYLE
ncbi:TRO [Vulpes lagopus]